MVLNLASKVVFIFVASIITTNDACTKDKHNFWRQIWNPQFFGRGLNILSFCSFDYGPAALGMLARNERQSRRITAIFRAPRLESNFYEIRSAIWWKNSFFLPTIKTRHDHVIEPSRGSYIVDKEAIIGLGIGFTDKWVQNVQLCSTVQTKKGLRRHGWIWQNCQFFHIIHCRVVVCASFVCVPLPLAPHDKIIGDWAGRQARGTPLWPDRCVLCYSVQSDDILPPCVNGLP